ncbi:MAG: hypothetical protein ABIJ47_08630 [Candidatus Bathyarchaeota archaeon]
MFERLYRQRLRAAIVYFPLVVGIVFTALGVMYSMEVSQGHQAVILPYYGVLPFASRDFEADEMTFEVTSISLEEGYVDCMLAGEVAVQGEGEIMFGLQVPHRVEGAFFKVMGLDDEKSREIYYTGDAVIEWVPEEDVSVMYYEFKPESKYPMFTVMVSFRWFGAVSRVGYTSYELAVPFSNSDSEAALDVRPDACWLSGEPLVSLRVDLPVESRVVESIPQPVGESIYWREWAAGHRSLILEGSVRFGSPHGYPLLQSFRVVFELPGLRERYDRLVFDSGLFLGVGVQFLLAGVYDAVKLRNRE